MKIGQIKTKSKKFLSVNKYHPILLGAGTIGLLAAIVLLAFAISWILNMSWIRWYGLALLAVLFVFSAPVEYSSTEFYLRSYNLKTSENFKLFEGFKKENFWRCILIRLLRTGLGLAFTVLLIVPGVLFFLRTAFVYYVVQNNPKTSAWDAIRGSNQLVKGHTFELFKLSLSFMGWFLLGIISFGIGFIYVSPYYHTAKSIFFRNVMMEIGDDEEIPVPKKDEATVIEELERRIEAMEHSGVSAENGGAQSKVAESAEPEAAQPFEQVQVTVEPTVVEPVTDFTATQFDTVPQSDFQQVQIDEMPNVAPQAPAFEAQSKAAGSTATATEASHSSSVKVEPHSSVVNRQNTAPTTGETPHSSRSIEINENESFEDFKTRIAKIRQDRGTQSTAATGAASGRPQVGANTSAAQNANNTPPQNDAQRRPTREEILEKLRRGRK